MESRVVNSALVEVVFQMMVLDSAVLDSVLDSVLVEAVFQTMVLDLAVVAAIL
jgi:hypothetical protein